MHQDGQSTHNKTKQDETFNIIIIMRPSTLLLLCLRLRQADNRDE